MNLPNKLTIIRILLVPVMVVVALLGLEGEFLGIRIRVLAYELNFCCSFNY